MRHPVLCDTSVGLNSFPPGINGRSPGDDVTIRVVYHFDTGSLASIGIDIPYTGTGWSVFRSVFLGVGKILADVMVWLSNNNI